MNQQAYDGDVTYEVVGENGSVGGLTHTEAEELMNSGDYLYLAEEG